MLAARNPQHQVAGRRIINLAGFLGSETAPETINSQLTALSGLLIQQEAFDALLEPVLVTARSRGGNNLQATEISSVLASLEETRKALHPDSPINYSELIAWLVAAAQASNIPKPRRQTTEQVAPGQH
mgnify:FL=1|tara:strand:- start:2548 stop:2931 length:384 start_codon:yes stop_codon:yes gene_type:complete